jgi:hypothetical protein
MKEVFKGRASLDALSLCARLGKGEDATDQSMRRGGRRLILQGSSGDDVLFQARFRGFLPVAQRTAP